MNQDRRGLVQIKSKSGLNENETVSKSKEMKLEIARNEGRT